MSSIKEKIKLEPTVAQITRFKSEDYSISIMLAELIDNSISSWEKLNESTRSNLKIKIIFFSDFDDSSEIISENSEIIIQDNAAGMTYEEIIKAAPPYNTENKGKGDLNQYGIGLKSAGGWFCEDTYIYSKTQNDHIINYLEFRTSDKNKYEPYSPVVAKLDINNSDHDDDFISHYYDKQEILISPEKSGTTIVMKKIYEDTIKFDYLWNKDKRNALFAFLGWKYKYYIRDEGLELEFHDEKYMNGSLASNKTNLYKIGDFEIKPWKLSDFKEHIRYKYVNNKNNSNESEKDINDTFASKFEDFLKDIKIIEDDDSSSDKAKEVCRLILEDKDIMISDNIKLNDVNYELKYGIISPNAFKYTVGLNETQRNIYTQLETKYGYKNLQGISTYHHNRGINIGPWLDKDYWRKKQPQTISFAENREKIDGQTSPQRLYGEIHLDGFNTEINKTVFLWDDDSKDYLTSKLKDIWDSTFKKILTKMIKLNDIVDNSNSPKKLNVSSIEKINDNISQKMHMSNEDVVVEHTSNNGVNTWKYTSKYKDKRYIFALTEEKNKSNKPFICKLVSEDEENIKYSISYDFFHSIWSPINTNGSSCDSRIVAHPIIVSLALAQWIINDKQNNASNFTNLINKKNRKDIDLFDIIDEIVKDWREFNDNEWQ